MKPGTVPTAHRLPAWMAAFAGIAFAAWLYGLQVLDPAATRWLLHGDPAQHYLGSVFFRLEAWHWPPGLIARFGDTPTSLIFTDSIALAALPAKALGPWLGLDPLHQYFGLWMAGCHAAAAYAGVRLLQRLGTPSGAALVGGVFFATAPALLLRAYGHESLMAQALVLAALNRALAPWRTLPWLLLGALALLVHPYFVFMVGALGLASAASALHEHRLAWRQAVLLAPSTLVGAAAIAWLAGYLVGGAQRLADGFGYFSANLLSWFDPMDWAAFLSHHGRDPAQGREWSRLLPALRQATVGQYEGFAYLGAGLLGLLALVSGRFVISHLRHGAGQPALAAIPRVRWAWVGAACGLMLVLALSNRPSVGAYLLPQWPIPAAWEPLFGLVRASGRFIWPATYLLMALTLARVARWRHGAGWLLVALLVQAWDISPKWFELQARFRDGPPGMAQPVQDPVWAHALARCPRLELVPRAVETDPWIAPALAAAQARASINPAPTARPSPQAWQQRQQDVATLLGQQTWQTDTVYLLLDALPQGHTVPGVLARLPPGITHRLADGYTLVMAQTCLD